MDKIYDFRILVIDDNPEIHNDFIKVLTNPHFSSHANELAKKLFNKEQLPEKQELLPD